MFLQGFLKKMFHMRDKAGQRRPKGADDGFDAEEKPFLDHLEDLRSMFFKMLVTVIVTVTAASIFNVQLVELIQLPVKWAGIGKTDAMSAIFNLKQVKEARFHPGELVLLQGGLIAKVVSEDLEVGVTKLDIATGVLVTAKTDMILGTIPSPAGEVKSGDLNRISTKQVLVMETFTPSEGLMIVIKLVFFSAIVAALPLLLWFAVEFVLPGLRQSEKRAVFPALFASTLLFLFGAFFAFRVGLPFALRWLLEWNVNHGFFGGWRVGYYIEFVTQVVVVFGLTFQLPVVIFVLISLELLSYETMKNSRSYAIMAILFVAAVLTPPDPITLILLGGPLVMLYEGCIWIAWFQERGRRRKAAAEEKKRAADHARRLEELSRLPAAEPEAPPGPDAPGESPSDHSLVQTESGGDPGTSGFHEDPYHDWHGHDSHHDHGHAAYYSSIDINHATIEELQRLPGIGPKLAQRIVDARPFYSQEELEYHAHLPQSVIKLIVDRIYFH